MKTRAISEQALTRLNKARYGQYGIPDEKKVKAAAKQLTKYQRSIEEDLLKVKMVPNSGMNDDYHLIMMGQGSEKYEFYHFDDVKNIRLAEIKGNYAVILIKQDAYIVQDGKSLKDSSGRLRVFPIELSMRQQKNILSLLPRGHIQPLPPTRMPMNETESRIMRTSDLVSLIRAQALNKAGLLSSTNLCLSVRSLINGLVRRLKSETEKIYVFDVGTGLGVFPQTINEDYSGRVVCEGISLVNYCAPLPLPAGVRIGDVQSLADIQHGPLYDLIVAWHTAIHVAQPEKMLEALYRVTKPNGSIIIDEFMLSGLTSLEHQAFINQLKRQGHEIAGVVVQGPIRRYGDLGVDQGKIQGLVLKKTSAPLDLRFLQCVGQDSDNRFFMFYKLKLKPEEAFVPLQAIETGLAEIKALLPPPAPFVSPSRFVTEEVKATSLAPPAPIAVLRATTIASEAMASSIPTSALPSAMKPVSKWNCCISVARALHGWFCCSRTRPSVSKLQPLSAEEVSLVREGKDEAVPQPRYKAS